MIEVADSDAVYYYHYDALGSVVALSDSSGDTVQTYEYSVYGQVAAEDPNHPNPYMFTGRRFDIEIGLYYYRARYYNPFTGRFLQTDPIGYDDGINWYLYCNNNPLAFVDPSGNWTVSRSIPVECVWDVAVESTAYADVYDFLLDTGFFDLYPDVNLISVSLSGDHYDCVFGDACDLDIDPPTFETTTRRIGGFPVFVVNGIGLLDKRSLDKIMRDTLEEINSWTWWNPVNFHRLLDLDSPFHKIGPYDPIRFRFMGKIFEACEINYMAQGHAHRHMRLRFCGPGPGPTSLDLVSAHNLIFLPMVSFYPGPQIPTRKQLTNKIRWTLYGYTNYAVYDNEDNW